jgi:hypothetical protein
MTVLSALQGLQVLEPSEAYELEDVRERLDETQWQDIHLAAADLHLRHRLAAREPLELPVQPSSTETVTGLLTADTGIMCLGGLPPRDHLDRRFDVFLFTGDVIKAGPELPTDPDAFLQALQDLAEQMGQGLEVLGVAEQDREVYQRLQPVIWASRAVVYYGPETVGRDTVEDAVQRVYERYLEGGVAAGSVPTRVRAG